VRLATRRLVKDRLSTASLLDLQDLQASAPLFDGIGAADEGVMGVADAAHVAERFTGAWVSANTFSLIGHRPARRRLHS